ncbi:hypothetical protein BY458DRAFT_504092 [Sporodiniella umbellata]|nr:hypothetical protein BY458DRAFT_504092 [Sporodiniella umbellata]
MSFLKDSDILQKRTRGRKKSRYLESLQQLKDRKTSFDIPDEDLDGPIDKFFGHSQNTKNASDSELNSAEDSDFVVEDDVIDGVRISISSKDRGKEERMDMPAEFSKNRVLSWSKQFGIYIEYLVAICLDIEVESSDEYKLAKNAVVRRVESYKDSILTSDVWLSKFKHCVDLYPNWQMGEKKSDYSENLCQACKANKPAVITINLFSDEDNIGVKFDLGRECYRKAQLYHGFTHFETKIYREVEGHVNRLIKKHSGLKEQVCDAICDELNGSGVIKRLFRETKQDFVKTIRIYNLKGERYILEDTSSSDD